MKYSNSILNEKSRYITWLIDNYLNCDMLSFNEIGEGFYGTVYLIHIAKDPYKLIVKMYKHSGRGVLEYQQLSLLRKHSLLKVPQVYFVHNKSEAVPFDVLIMEYIEGINASKLPTEHPNRDAFADEMIANLIHIHSISNENGFGVMGEMYPDWKTCLGIKIRKMHLILHSNFQELISPYVMEIADKSIEAFDKIFVSPVKSSLIHSDYNLWNILVDEKSAKITAVIDPIDAGWADREMDLFHLQNANGDRFELLERYQRNVKLSELFPLKDAFYWFWDDIKHMENTGWYDENRFTSFANMLSKLLEEYVGK
jgi:fructosamine-3-kinase